MISTIDKKITTSLELLAINKNRVVSYSKIKKKL